MNAFYLNYVGCKGFKDILMVSDANLFYLNYVGCKAISPPVIS